MENKKDSIGKRLRDSIINAANVYSGMTGKIYLYVCNEKYFELLFATGSFKHLTGVASPLTAENFYEKAVKRKLTEKQIIFTSQNTIKKAKRKLPCLARLPELTNSTICIVRDLKTDTLLYKIGLTNLEFTLGVAQPTFQNQYPVGVYIPRTLRIKDKAIERSSDGDFVDFIFEKPTKSLDYPYEKLCYRRNDSAPPEIIRALISEAFYKN